MNARDERRGKAVQRGLALFLLFLFVSDIGYHIAESFWNPPDGPPTPVLGGGHGSPEPDYGCPIPGHGDTPFHHHHFYALVTHAPAPIPLISLAQLSVTRPVSAVYASSVTPIGRAPPFA